MLVFLFVPGCNKKHTHDYEDATCTQPKICTICGQTEGDPLGHTYDNDCDDICNVCGETRIVMQLVKNQKLVLLVVSKKDRL